MDYAWELIDEIHPIAKTPLYTVYPALRPFRKCLGWIPHMNYEELDAAAHDREMDDLLAGKERTVTINGRQVVKRRRGTIIANYLKSIADKPAAAWDPLAQLGYGIVAYIDILWTMLGLFVLFSLLLFPTMRAYQSGTAFHGDHRPGWATGMIGNLGYSTVECAMIPVSVGRVAVTCPYGSVGEIIDFGVNNQASGSPPDACLTNDQNRSCEPTNPDAAGLFQPALGKWDYMVRFTKSDLYTEAPGKLCTSMKS